MRGIFHKFTDRLCDREDDDLRIWPITSNAIAHLNSLSALLRVKYVGRFSKILKSGLFVIASSDFRI